MSIDALLAELDAALLDAGLPATRPPAISQGLSEAQAAIAPFRFPDAVRDLWQRVDALVLAVQLYPPLLPPAFGLHLWRQDRPSMPYPSNLFPLCFESWGFTLVELASDEHEGGELWSWHYGGADFKLEYRDVEDWLGVLVDIVRNRAFETLGDGVLADVDRFREIAAERLSAQGIHPLYPQGAVPGQARGWPRHWRTAAGLVPE